MDGAVRGEEDAQDGGPDHDRDLLADDLPVHEEGPYDGRYSEDKQHVEDVGADDVSYTRRAGAQSRVVEAPSDEEYRLAGTSKVALGIDQGLLVDDVQVAECVDGAKTLMKAWLKSGASEDLLRMDAIQELVDTQIRWCERATFEAAMG